MDPTQRYIPSASPVAAALSNKLERLQQAGLEKRAALEGRSVDEQLASELALDRQTKTNAELRATYGNAVADADLDARAAQVAEQRTAQRDRHVGELVDDFGKSIVRTTVDMVGGAVGLANTLAQDYGPGGTLNKLAEDGTFGAAIQQRYREARTNTDELITGTTGKISQALARRLSPVSQANEARVATASAKDEAENQSNYDAAIEAGHNKILAKAERIGADLVDGFGNTIENPTVLSNTVVGQIPTLGVGAGAKAAVTTEQIATRALSNALRQDARKVLAGGSLREEAARQLATRNLMVGTGASEGAGAYQQSAAEILETPIATLAEQYPDYADRLLTDVNPDAVRAELAQSVGLRAAAIVAPLAGAAGRVAARFELNPVSSGVDDVGETVAERAVARLTGNAVNVAQETGEETIQSGAGQFGINAAQATASRDVDLAEGVGGAAGQGAAGGFGMSAAFQAPGAVRDTAVATAALGLDVAQSAGAAVLEPLLEAGKQARAEAQKPVEAQANENTARRHEVAASVDSTLQELGTSLPDDSVLGAPSLERVATLSRVLEAAKTEQDPDKLDQLQLYGAKTARELRTMQAGLAQALEAETDPEKKTRLASLDRAINELTNNEDIVGLEEAIADVSPAAIEAVFAKLPATIDTGTITAHPEVLRTLDLARELTHIAPDKITPAMAERMVPLYQITGASEQDLAQLQLAQSVGQAIAQHAEAGAKIRQQFPNSKTSDEVRTEILDKGFDTGKTRLPSLREYVRDVSAAMASGETGRATMLMDNLANFASHYGMRAEAFDATAKRAIEEGRQREFLEVIRPAAEGKVSGIAVRTLDEHGQLSNQNYKLKLDDERSRETIDHVFADSNLVAGVYNTLATQFPELNFPADGVTTQAPTWTKHTRSPKAPTNVEAPAQVEPQLVQPTEQAAPAQAEVVAEPAAVADPVEQPADPGAADNAVAEAQDPELAKILAEAQAAFEAGKNVTGVDFNSAPTADLSEALALSEKDYLARVSSGQVTDAQTADAIAAELDDMEAPARAEKIGSVGTVDLLADGDFLYAVEGDQVVGRLGSKASATEFAVHPDKQGQGIGRAMMRELLLRDPFALSGGLSEGAKATRLSVLRELREERTPTMAKRFSALADLAGGDLKSKNQWLQAFRLNLEHRGVQGLQALRERLDSVEDLLPTEREGLATVANTLAPAIVKLLDQQLTAYAAKDPRANGTDSQLWQYGEKLSLHATNYGRGEPLAYDPAIAEGVALATSLWLMETIGKEYPADDKYIAQFLGKAEDRVLPAEKHVFQTGQIQDAMVTELARYIPGALGVSADANASVTSTDGIVQALAANALNVLLEQKVLTRTKYFIVHEAEGSRIVTWAEAKVAKDAGTSIKPFYTLSYNRSEDSDSLQPLRQQLGAPGTRALSALVDPDREQEWQIGTPHAKVEKKVRGSEQSTSPQQKKILRNQNAVEFHRNTQMVQWLLRLGQDHALKLFGYVEFDPEQVNQIDRVRLDGINAGLVRSWQALVDWNTTLEREAQARGVKPEELATHFAHYLTSNNRVMMEGAVNPQSNKLLREALVATRSLMKLGDAEHETALRLMVGQALEAAGVAGLPKIENARSHADIAAAVDTALSEDGELFEVWTAMADPDLEGSTLMGLMEQAGFTPGGASVKAFHALQAWASYQTAKAAGAETVEIHLAFEQDGKTDGPANAMAQLGLHQITDVLFDNLDRAGYLFNRGETALGDVAQDIGDLYGAVARGAQERFRTKIQALSERYKNSNLPQVARFTAESQGRGLAGAVRLFGRIGSVKGLDAGGNLMEAVFGRNFAKQPVTSTGYSGGVSAIAGAMNKQIQELLYTALTAGIQSDTVIDEQLASSINALVTTELVWIEGKDGKKYLNAKTVGKPIDFGDVGRYRKLELSPQQLRAMQSHLREGLAKMLRASIKDEMGSTLEGMDKVVTTARIQTLVLQHEFDKAYAAKLEELVAADKLLPEQMLSRAQEREILAGLKTLAPVTQFLTTDSVGDRSVGLNMAQSDRNAQVEDEFGVRKTASIIGGLSTSITRLGFKDPGVRAGALTVISAGDATMMANYFAKVRQALNVWDGLEVGLAQLFGAGREINQAVHDAWQFDLLGGISRQFAEALPGLLAAVKADPNLDTLLHSELKLEEEQTVEAFLSDYAHNLQVMADDVGLAKRALGNLGLSIDHMAGARRPFVKNGVTVPREQLVEWVQTEVNRLRNQKANTAAATAVESVVGAPEGEKTFAELQLSTRANHDAVVKLMDTRMAASSNKVHQFVWKQIRGLLPTDLVVHRGPANELLATMKAAFPGMQLPPADKIAAGAYLQGQVFLGNDSTETLLHELIHASVTGLIDRAYAGGQGLTAHQKQAVLELETLAGAFLDLDPGTVDPLTATALSNAQHTVESLLDRGDVGAAVNEFLAWTLSNRELARQLQATPAPTGLKALAKKVLGQVRKLLGLPNNATMVTFLEQTLGQFVRLTRVGNAVEDLADGRVLFQLLQDPGVPAGAHEAHLGAVHAELMTVLQAVPPHLITAESKARQQAALDLGRRQRDAFLAAGFPLNQQEQMVFELAQAVFASGLQLDPRVMTALQHLHQAAVKDLAVEDFMTDPDSTDTAVRSVAQQQYNAVIGNTAVAMDADNRSTLLANFVALSLVHQPLRVKLQNLSLPKAPDAAKTADAQLRAWVTRLFDRVADASLGVSPNLSQRAALDVLVTRLAESQLKWSRRARTAPTALDKLEQQTRERMEQVGTLAERKLQERHAAGKQGGMDGWINLALNGIRAMTTDDASANFGESVLAVTNRLPTDVRNLFAELVGGTEVNAPVHRLLNRARSMVAQVRQRLREEAPVQVRALFSKELGEQTWAGLVRWVGKTDLQSLLGHYSGNQVQGLLEDSDKLATEIARLENQLQAHPEWVAGAENLAHYLMTGTQLAGHGPLYRNAAALARLVGFGKHVTGDPKKTTLVLDRLITLKALSKLDPHETNELAELFRSERAGIEGLVKLMRQRVMAERGKHHGDRQRFNQWKGYVPVSMDPRRDVVLAGPKRGLELVKQGYTKLESYQGDGTDPSQGLAYYAIAAGGGRATYNQGALQTVEGSVMGVDHLTGATLDPAVKTLIKDPKVVARITALKRRQPGRSSANDLLPVFDADGTVVAYERPLSKRVLDQHLRAKPDLAQSIGMWMGRQAEEAIAQEFNGQVIAVLKKTWDDFQGTNRAGEFVDIADPKASATLRDTWNAIPRETQTMLKQEFGGAVMVRVDMLNNALGYRSASIGDAFTGMGDLPEDVREAIVNVASALPGLGKDAYQRLVAVERGWQGLVGAAKDLIVVRSGVVALANGIANVFQVYVHTGHAPWTIAKIMASKAAETETYLRNAHRAARIQVELDMTTRPDQRKGLERELQGLHDLNRRLSIWPLIEAGELPAIAEGLSEQDEYSILGDAMDWVSKKAENLPKGVVTAAKYALISKDTALYQGLNRMIQFGDFMAKAAVYDHLVEQQGADQETALRKVSERFVNYNLLAGRSRDYLESMGLTWFMNYKLRIQKVVLATVRENPLRFLLAGAGADWLGADSLVTSSAPLTHWEYALGPGQFFRAEDAILWNQLMH